MPRKQKDVYLRIQEKEIQINNLKSKISICENELIQLNKERESLEMHQIFETAKQNNLSFQQVIDMISKSHNK